MAFNKVMNILWFSTGVKNYKLLLVWVMAKIVVQGVHCYIPLNMKFETIKLMDNFLVQ